MRVAENQKELEVKIEDEDPDFDQEKVWKKIFKRVECEFCSDDGECSAFWNKFDSRIIKCSKWEDFSEPCVAGGVCQGTIAITFSVTPGQIQWTVPVGWCTGT